MAKSARWSLIVFMLNMNVCGLRGAEFSAEQCRALQLTLEWMQDPELGNGKPPGTRDLREMGFEPSRLLGVGNYRKRSKSAIFKSPEEFWLALHRLAKSRQVPLRLLDVTWKDRSELGTMALRTEALELILTWMQDPLRGAGRPPHKSDFGPDAQQIPLEYSRLTSMINYAPGQQSERYGLFPSPQAFWLEFKRYAQSQGIQIHLLNVPFRGPMGDELKQTLQQEALARVSNWIQKNQRLPQFRDFGREPGQIGISYVRLMATGDYAPGKKVAASAIFQNTADFWQQLLTHSKSQNFSDPLLNKLHKNISRSHCRSLLAGNI